MTQKDKIEILEIKTKSLEKRIDLWSNHSTEMWNTQLKINKWFNLLHFAILTIAILATAIAIFL